MNDRVAGMTTALASLSPAPVVYLHVALFLEAGAILGDGSFRLVSFKGQESISDHFEYELELHGNSDPESGLELAFDDLLGRPVTVGVHYPVLDDQQQPTREEANEWFDQAVHGQDEGARLSLFNGIVASFSMEQPGVYRATMRPALWKLTLTNNYCIHRQLNVRDAIAGVLRKHNVDFSVAALVGSGNLAVARQQDWLQAGETDYEFVRRLMSKAHIYYFYVSTGTSHTVVFANRPVYPEALPDGKPLRYCGTQEDTLGLAQPDMIGDYRFQQSLASSAVASVFTREEAAWESDAVAGFQSFHAQTKPAPGALPFNQYQIYQYGCSDVEVDHYARATQDTLDTGSRQFSGSSYCPYLHCGHRFSVTQEVRSGQWPPQVRPQLEGMSFVATQVQHEATLDGSYSNRFQATDAQGLVTPFSIQETQQGSVLASVVSGGSQGVAPVGWRYMQKDNFDPETSRVVDSEGIAPVLEAQGVYVRFSTSQDIFSPDGADPAEPVWVKLAAHMQTVPEIGATVIITRAQDQSELPEIQSIIQANGTKVIMPSGWTANTNVGSSYSTAYGDGKSIRFGLRSDADLDNAVAIVSQQYDSGKFRESSYSQGATYGYSTSEDGANGLLSQSDSFGSTHSTHKGAESWSSTEFGTTTNHSLVTGSATNTSKTEGTLSNTTSQNLVFNTTTTASQISESFTVSSVNLDVTGQHFSTSAVGMAVSASATGVRLSGSMEGMSSSSSMVGLSDSDSVVGMSMQTSATGSSSNVAVTLASDHVSMTLVDTGTNLVGVSSSTSMTGASTAMNLVGAHNEVSLTGLSSRVSLTGQSNSVSVLGSSTDISLSGDTTAISMKGASTSIEMTGAGILVQLTALQASMQITGLSLTITELKIYL
ncbi:contractile injection system protein, VgrG/Pvc8 family [Polaromonas aquatica]|uniref:contractile injection system protein, VgrG/Pvc8 family n=1 Tax=Polaromonas aquatica TaxID=332657 RepID=UPI003D653B7A